MNLEWLRSSQAAIFGADVAINLILLAGVVWSVAWPARRVWPPPDKGSWQQVITWVLFCAAFGLNILLLVIDWDTWLIPPELRFLLGIPLAVIGALLVSWGIAALGAARTSGLARGLLTQGPYRHTRNPQYLGDILLFCGISLIANSLQVAVVHLLMALVFLFTPLAEEPWLERSTVTSTRTTSARYRGSCERWGR